MWKKNTDEERFSQWINDHHGALFKHALWMTGNSDVAKDLVQETYYQAWKSKQSLKDESYVLGWLLTILRRCSYREHHSQMRQELIAVNLDLFDQDESKLAHYELIDLSRAMQKLSTSHCEILLLHELHGFSYKEISRQLDIPIGTVMSRLSRAKKHLKNHFSN